MKEISEIETDLKIPDIVEMTAAEAEKRSHDYGYSLLMQLRQGKYKVPDGQRLL